HAKKKLRFAVIVSNYGQHVAHAHTPDSRIDGGIESADRDVPIRRQSRRVGLQIRTEASFSRGFFLSASVWGCILPLCRPACVGRLSSLQRPLRGGSRRGRARR